MLVVIQETKCNNNFKNNNNHGANNTHHNTINNTYCPVPLLTLQCVCLLRMNPKTKPRMHYCKHCKPARTQPQVLKMLKPSELLAWMSLLVHACGGCAACPCLTWPSLPCWSTQHDGPCPCWPFCPTYMVSLKAFAHQHVQCQCAAALLSGSYSGDPTLSVIHSIAFLDKVGCWDTAIHKCILVILYATICVPSMHTDIRNLD